MRVIQITKPEYCNETIRKAINFILTNVEIVDKSDEYKGGVQIGELMAKITDKTILNDTVKLLKDNGYFTNNNEFSKIANNAIIKPEIAADVKVRVKAICYELLLKKRELYK